MKKGKLCASLRLCTTLFCTPHVAHAFDAMDFEHALFLLQSMLTENSYQWT